MSNIRFAVISGGTVINVIIGPDDFELEDMILVASDTAQIGQLYSGGSFSDPPAPPVELPPIDAWRFEAAIELAGIKSAIDAAIAALPEPDRTIAKAKRARVQQYHRDDPLIAALAPGLSLSDESVDALWQTAMGF